MDAERHVNEEFDDDLPPPPTAPLLNPEVADFEHESAKYDDALQTWVMRGNDNGNTDDDDEWLWDRERRGWFPKYRDALIAEQQSIYEAPSKNDAQNVAAAPSAVARQKKAPRKPTVNAKQSSVYVTGLPGDATAEELHRHFAKCGVLLPDLTTGQPRIKLYRDEKQQLKGDALVTYYKPESVELALVILDDAELRPGVRLRVQQAKFQRPPVQAAQTKPTSTETAKPEKPAAMENAPAPSMDKRKIELAKRKMDSLLDWTDPGADANTMRRMNKAARTVVIKHMFTKQEFDDDPAYLLDLKESVWEECGKFGEVTAVNVHDTHPEGVVVVRFREGRAAVTCRDRMHGRFFAGRQLLASLWDGFTKYGATADGGAEALLKHGSDDDDQEEARLERFADWLEHGGSEKKQKDARQRVDDEDDIYFNGDGGGDDEPKSKRQRQ